MATNYNARIATRGLALSVDAANPASLPTNIRRNLITQSENLSNAAWGKVAVDAAFTSMTAPDGSLTVYSITEQANSAQHLLYYSIGTVVINDTFTWSGHFKNNTNTTQIVLHTNGEGTVTFNISGATAGTVAGTGGANTLSSSIVSLGNGWYRCAATFRKANNTGTFYVSNQNGLGVYTGSTNISYFAWGLQLEYSSAVSSYYPVSTLDSMINTRWYDVTGTSRPVPFYQNLTSVEVLVVAGGGAGGPTAGGGGGAGGLIYNTQFPVVLQQSYTVTVGAGGSADGSNGANSVFGTLTAIGGGGGGQGWGGLNGNSGGSGGGCSAAGANVGQGTFNQGFPGGNSSQIYNSGGGGGAGGPGLPANGTTNAGNGGPGITLAISGTDVSYAGGGGGGIIFNTASGTGTAGGGRGGFSGGTPGTSGTLNTGGGGGGGGNNNPIDGSRAGGGGSGVVIVRYPGQVRATGGTVTSVNGFNIHTFTSGTGAFTPFQIPAGYDYQSYGSFVNVTTPVLYDSRNSGALVFNNLDNYVAMPELPSQTNSPLSVFAWVFLNATPAVTNGIWGHYGVNNNNIHYEINPTATRLRLGDINKGDLPMLAVGSWQFVGFTSTGSSHSYYVNGVLSTTWAGTTGTILGGNGTFPSSHMIGRSDATRTWNGRIAQVAIYTAELTAAEVLNNFNALRGRYAV